jgi:cytochrome P450
MIGWIFLVVFVVVVLLFLLKKLLFSSKPRSVPPSFVKEAAGRLPVLGHALEFSPDACLQNFKEYPLKFGKFVEFYLGPIRTVLITDTDIAKEVMLKTPKKFVRMKMMNYAAEQLGVLHSLLFAEGTVWTHVRKSVTPSFSNLNVTNKFSMFVGEMFHWMDRIHNQVQENPKKTFDMKYECFTLTIRVISIIAFGLTEADSVCSYFFSEECLLDIRKIFKFMSESAAWVFPRIIWRYSPLYKYEREGLEAGNRFTIHCQEVINYKKDLMQKKNYQKNFSMIDSLLINEATATEKALSDEEIISNVKIFYIAGADTTGVTMSWVCYYFAVYPNYCQRLRQEVKEILFQNRDPMANREEFIRSIDITKVGGMKLANAIVKETLRINSPAPCVGVEPGDSAVELSNGLSFEPGDMVFVNVDGIHQDPEIFENPFEFYPERWLTEDPVKLNKMESSLLPFGYGPRVCPGMNLAMLESALAISFLAYFFDMALDCPVDEIKRIINFSAVANKMPIKLVPVGFSSS